MFPGFLRITPCRLNLQARDATTKSRTAPRLEVDVAELSAAISAGRLPTSVSGIPSRIFHVLGSMQFIASWNWQPRASESNADAVVLRDPETPSTQRAPTRRWVLNHRARADYHVSVRSFVMKRRASGRRTAGFPSAGPLGGRPQNELPHRLRETLILIAVCHRARLRLHLVAGITHGD
jgi:hypothetical protein